SELNEEQYRVVTAGDGPCLVLAGAGSGKTRAITYRVAYLLEQGVSPERILLLTFTNKAADEMLRRVGQLAGGTPHGLWGGTFHKIGLRILRQYAELLGYRRDFSILDAEDSKDLVKICMKEEGLMGTKSFPGAGAVHGIISFSINADISIDEVLDGKYPQYEKFAETFKLIADRYREKKRTAQVMDFDDLLSGVVVLLQKNPRIQQKYAEQFQYVLVDEYQDTNALQSRFVDLLAAVHKNVLVVGDDAQSIYSFRAADINNILSFEKRHPNTTIFKLQTNYRSSPEILSLANEIIKQNKKQYAKKLQSMRDGAAKPEYLTHTDTAEEAIAIGQHLADLAKSGTPRNEMAVLFRSSFHSQELELELAKRNIPYDYRGGQRFFERAHVKDVLAYLRLAHNPKDIMAWMRVLSMYSGIGSKTAEKIIERVVALDELSTLDTEAVSAGLDARANIGWQKFARDVARLRDVEDKAPAKLIRAVLDSSYIEMLEQEHENHRERKEDLEQIARFAERADNLGDFLGETTLTESHSARLSRDTATENEPRVVLSTIHQAKGLEWDVVFILRMAAGA
ncbi:MAG: ATP-dependent helicase, partial [Patescibacteria group bacterium]